MVRIFIVGLVYLFFSSGDDSFYQVLEAATLVEEKSWCVCYQCDFHHQVVNASVNLPIFFFAGKSFREVTINLVRWTK